MVGNWDIAKIQSFVKKYYAILFLNFTLTTYPYPQGPGSYVKERANDFKSQMEWMTQRKQCLPDKIGLIHIWTHRNCGSIHRDYTGTRHCVPSAEMGKWT